MSETKSISTGTALYYPYIHPRNMDELKASLIYWDRVRRIVPRPLLEGGCVYDDDEDARVLAGEGLLVATPPGPYEEKAAERFFEHIEPNRQQFHIDINTARHFTQRHQGIHIEKLADSVITHLLDLGIAHRFDEWIAMRDEVAAFYMFCLASEMSSRMGAPLFSDSHEDAELGQSLLFERSSAKDVSEVLLRVDIMLPSPRELHHYSVHQIVEFCKRRSDERQQFRKVVEGIVEKARSIADWNAMDDYLASRRVEIVEAVKNLRATLDEIRVGAAMSVAKITVPAGIAAAIAALSLPQHAAAIFTATGLAVSAVSCWAETRGKLRQAKTSSPYHYLISIEKEFDFNTTIE